MQAMYMTLFSLAAAFVQDIGGWHVGAGKSTGGMFWGAVAFDAPANALGTPRRRRIHPMTSSRLLCTFISVPGLFCRDIVL